MHIDSNPTPVEPDLAAIQADLSALLVLAHQLGKRIEQAIQPAPVPRAGGALDLSSYRAPEIAAAVLALHDRRAALARTLVSRGIEARTGRRGRSASQDRVAAPAGNGPALHTTY